MSEKETYVSGISTLDASNLTYEFENARVHGAKDKDIVRRAQEENGKTIPPNLQYLDDFHEPNTGTSGTAFLDKDTLCYTIR